MPQRMSRRVALVSTAEYAHLDDDLAPLVDALADVNVDAVVADWHDTGVDWAGFDLAVVRSTWDYTWQLDAFLDWAGAVAGATELANPVAVLRWNTDKRYLAQLAAAGVPVVPTQVVEPGSSPIPLHGEVVVKPVVSAGGRDTGRYPVECHEAARSHLAELHDAGRAGLVQPYVADVDIHGETGLVYLGDQFSHAFRKGPILSAGTDGGFVDGLYREEHISARDASDAELVVAEAALDAVARWVPAVDRSDLLYARIDVVRTDDGPVVMELELVEPSLFLSVASGSPLRASSAIGARLQKQPR